MRDATIFKTSPVGAAPCGRPCAYAAPLSNAGRPQGAAPTGLVLNIVSPRMVHCSATKVVNDSVRPFESCTVNVTRCKYTSAAPDRRSTVVE